MLNVLVILAALAPVAVVIWYIYRKDRKQPEPTKLLIKAFIYGVFSALLTLVIVIPFEAITEFANNEVSNPYFDEHFDGIVYAVCIGMGFAAIENVLYLFDNYESWISVGIARALFTVPGHFLDAVIMGFYYSLWHFRILRNWQTCALILVGPILAHGIYNSIVFSMNIDDSLSGILLLLFLMFLNKLKNICKKHIADLVNH